MKTRASEAFTEEYIAVGKVNDGTDVTTMMAMTMKIWKKNCWSAQCRCEVV